MIKSPISKTGNIRFFELFKIVVLMSFLFGIISKGSNELSAISNSTSYISSALILIYTFVHTVLYGSKTIQLCISLVKEFLITIKEYKPTIVITKQVLSYISYKSTSLNLFRENNVIRC